MAKKKSKSKAPAKKKAAKPAAKKVAATKPAAAAKAPSAAAKAEAAKKKAIWAAAAAKKAAEAPATPATPARKKAPNESILDKFMGEAKKKSISSAQLSQIRINMNTIHPLENRIGRYKLTRGTMLDNFTITVIEPRA